MAAQQCCVLAEQFDFFNREFQVERDRLEGAGIGCRHGITPDCRGGVRSHLDAIGRIKLDDLVGIGGIECLLVLGEHVTNRLGVGRFFGPRKCGADGGGDHECAQCCSDKLRHRYRWVLFPFIGDLLWALRAKDGRHYCVNWSVKDSEEAFKRPLESKRFITPKGKLAEGVLVRHELESSYYLDAGIRTVFLAADAIDEHVRSNLRQLFLHHGRKIFLSSADQDELTERFRICLESGVPAFDLIAKLTGAGKYSLDDCRNVLFQAIWSRRLRVDLFQPIVINRPFNPETRDVLQVYANWFKELAPC